MKRFILLLLFIPSLVIASDSVKIGNLTVTVIDNNVQVYINSQHWWSTACSAMFVACKVYVATNLEPEYTLSDGTVTPISGLAPLKVHNIVTFKISKDLDRYQKTDTMDWSYYTHLEHNEGEYIGFLKTYPGALDASYDSRLVLFDVFDGSYIRKVQEYDSNRY